MAIKPKQTEQQQKAAGGVGLGADAWVEGGGLWDDFDGTILECAFVPWDYNGSIEDPVIALAAEIHNDDEEDSEGGNPNPFIQYFSAGDMKHFVPSDDGKEAIPVGSKTGLSKSTNAFKFISSMIAAGFDPSLIGNRVDVFEKARFHFKRIDQEERKGLKQQVKEGDRKKQVLIAESLIAMPGEAAKPGKPGGTAKPGAAKPATTSPKASTPPPTTKPTTPNKAVLPTPPTPPTEGHNVSDDVVAHACTYIIEKLSEAGGSHPKVGLAKDAANWAKANGLDIPTRNKLIQALGNEAFLSSCEDYGFTFDGEMLSLTS